MIVMFKNKDDGFVEVNECESLYWNSDDGKVYAHTCFGVYCCPNFDDYQHFLDVLSHSLNCHVFNLSEFTFELCEDTLY